MPQNPRDHPANSEEPLSSLGFFWMDALDGKLALGKNPFDFFLLFLEGTEVGHITHFANGVFFCCSKRLSSSTFQQFQELAFGPSKKHRTLEAPEKKCLWVKKDQRYQTKTRVFVATLEHSQKPAILSKIRAAPWQTASPRHAQQNFSQQKIEKKTSCSPFRGPFEG